MTGGSPAAPRGFPRRWVALVLLAAAAAGIGGGFVLQRARSAPVAATPRLPELHGQAVWPAGKRLAPNFTLRDPDGAPVSLASLRGRPVLLTFLDSRCHSACPIEGRELASIMHQLLSAERPVLVVVGVDPKGDNRAGIHHAVRAWGLAGPWRWHWLTGSRSQLAAVWRSYGITVQPTTNDILHSLAVLLIDRRGFERTAYLFPFLPSFVHGDLARLAGERA